MYMIEVQHPESREACLRALHALDQSGSHFVTHADFGCSDGVHCGWLTVDVEDRQTAQQIIPPEFRSATRVVELRKFTREEIVRMMSEHQA
jgi:hypothetical protein